jgi:hypothetical protein
LETPIRRNGARKQSCWRRGISLAMLIFGLQAMLTGIWQLFPPFNKQIDPLHMMPAFIFGILLIIHIWLNRKPLFRYFDRLGWRWVFIVLGAIGIIWAGIIMPLLFIGQ